MHISLTSMLALCTLLLLSSGVYFVAKRFRFPYTVLLVAVGLLLVPLVHIPGVKSVFGFLNDLSLTPELLFYVFLPVLIFETGYQTSLRRMIDSVVSISLLSVVGLFLSAAAIAGGLALVLPLVGLEVPILVLLLFASIISATDPVAVLALFKEAGAPKRLSLIFEGESLFNDGTAVALFLVVLGILQSGFHGASTISEGVFSFVFMVLGGIVVGAAAGVLFSTALRKAHGHNAVIVTLSLVSAHLVFVLCELFNEVNPFHLHLSSIIATTISSLALGNYARHVLDEDVDHFVHHAVGQAAFMSNSLVFLLSGLLFASSGVNMGTLWQPILVTVLIVAAARALMVFAITEPMNRFVPSERIPRSWQILLSWGSLRGALAIIMAMMIPTDLTVPGWTLPYSVHDFVLALTIGCILATLFIKGPTVTKIIARLGISEPEPLEQAEAIHVNHFQLASERLQLAERHHFGSLPSLITDRYEHSINQRREGLSLQYHRLVAQHGQELFASSLMVHCSHFERSQLRELYRRGEVTENVYRRLRGKLTLQLERAENGDLESLESLEYTDSRDVFDRVASWFERPLERGRPATFSIIEQYQYERAQVLLADTVLRELQAAIVLLGTRSQLAPVYTQSIERYRSHRNAANARAQVLLYEHTLELETYLTSLIRTQLHESRERLVVDLRSKGLPEELIADTKEPNYSSS